MSRPKRPLRDRFEERVDRSDTGGCWIWTGTIANTGYGHICDEDKRARMAHRVSYELHVGPIPASLQIDHLCRVTTCVNPAHLEPVTAQINTLRGIGPSAVNATKDVCKRGHALEGDNVYTYPTRNQRACRKCAALLARQYREAKK